MWLAVIFLKNSRIAGDLRCHDAHVTSLLRIMKSTFCNADMKKITKCNSEFPYMITPCSTPCSSQVKLNGTMQLDGKLIGNKTVAYSGIFAGITRSVTWLQMPWLLTLLVNWHHGAHVTSLSWYRANTIQNTTTSLHCLYYRLLKLFSHWAEILSILGLLIKC